LQHWKTKEHWTTAFSEMMVLNGQHNIAAYKPVSNSEGQDLILPGWRLEFLTDHQSPLGPPVNREVSPSNGTLCTFRKSRDVSEQFLQLDLQAMKEVDCVVLYPSRPTDYADAPGSGFPLHFKLSGSMDPEFKNEKILFEVSDMDYVNPGDNPVTIQFGETKLRYIRFTALKLYDRKNRNSMSLAEMEVYSKGVNVAFGKMVSSPHVFRNNTYPRWYGQALVDGYNSQFKLLPLPEWLRQLEQKEGLGLELDKLQLQIEDTRSQALVILMVFLVLIVFIVLFWSVIMLRKYAREKRLIQEQLRKQISRDLHDEIGSQLGGIALLSNSHVDRDDIPADLRDDLKQISQVAYESGDAMKDIIWLVKEEDRNLKDVLQQIKRIASRTLIEHAFELQIQPEEWPEEYVTLEARRHFVLAFKEILHNIIKHAHAKKVDLQLNLNRETRELILKVCDDGIGFDLNTSSDGMGLDNLKQRAKMLEGSCHVSSAPSCGTTIEFRLKY
jgi:signal transduction histidine kinase